MSAYCISGFDGVAETQPVARLSNYGEGCRSINLVQPCCGTICNCANHCRRTIDRRSTRMAVADDIATERQRLADRLARIDAERQKLADQIAELEAAERVLSRMTPGRTGARRGRRAQTGEAAAAAPTGAPGRRGRRAESVEAMDTVAGRATRRGRTGRGRGTARPKPEVSLADATLRAIEALGNEVSAAQIREYLGEHFGMQVRANHLGRALQSHRRAGRLREDGGRGAAATAR